MSSSIPPEPAVGERLLRRLDQLAVAGLIAFALVALVWYWIAQGALSHRLIEIDRVDPRTVTYHVDLNSADWTEFVALPEIGEALAHRIVDYRKKYGPYQAVDDLRHVRGIGPKTMERLRPYLAPIKSEKVAEK
ncbi:MAG TPA: helix-hairpin-helix domain-containing protein [Pirellulales bacterium]|jgi:competence protein ComEA